VLSNQDMNKLQSKRLLHFPNTNFLLKISLGLILFTIISSALVYAETITINVDGTSYDIEYTATGMTVSGIEADLDFISLILTVDVTDFPGTLDITFDRSFFDSLFQGEDEEFIILADGDEPNSTETETTSQSRTLSIELPAGTEEVEIIGSIFDNPVSGSIEDSDMDTNAAADKAAADKAAADTKTTQKTQCGPGTILKDGACVLDERCGPGTILKDGACVVESTPKSSDASVKGLGKELIVGVIATFLVAGVIAIIFGIIAKANKSSN
jgi:hypothetical protein